MPKLDNVGRGVNWQPRQSWCQVSSPGLWRWVPGHSANRHLVLRIWLLDGIRGAGVASWRHRPRRPSVWWGRCAHHAHVFTLTLCQSCFGSRGSSCSCPLLSAVCPALSSSAFVVLVSLGVSVLPCPILVHSLCYFLFVLFGFGWLRPHLLLPVSPSGARFAFPSAVSRLPPHPQRFARLRAHHPPLER